MPPRKKNWLQSASKEMKREGSAGLFTRKAKAHGKSVPAYANEVIKRYKGKTNTKAEVKLLRQAVFAKNAQKFRKR